jgi:hypothetical protein
MIMSDRTRLGLVLPTDCNAYNRQSTSDKHFAGRSFSHRIVVGLDEQLRVFETRKEEIKRRARDQISKIAEDAANQIRALARKKGKS